MKQFITNWRIWVERLLVLAILVFQLLAMSFAVVPIIVHRIVFLSLTMLLVFFKESKNKWEKITNGICIPILLAQMIYVLSQQERLSTRITFIDDPTKLDLIFGIALILIVIEATRRVAGNGLTVIVGIFIAYGFLGPYIPGPLRHSGFSIVKFVETQVLSSNGIFGIPIGAVISYVFYFIVFTAFLEHSGGGQLFIDAAIRVAGRARGGPAKAAVIASGAMGSISGSAVANVVGTGAFTIPLMKKTGFPPHYAGAIEAAASTGGQLMPPIMGAAAFIMAEVTGISYAQIALSALVPALLYYFGVFAQVDLFARKTGLEGIAKSDLPDLAASTKRYGHLMISLAALVFFIFQGSSLMISGLRATVLLIALSFLRKETRMWPAKCMEALRLGLRSLPTIAVPCAAAGIIIGVAISTNLGIQFGNAFLAMAEGSKFLTFFAMMIVCIILGMGMPTVSAYIIVVMLMVPSVIQLGVPVLAAHMFVFYFSLLSFVTPPVALAAYTAAGIAGSDAAKTGFVAFGLTLGGFIVPYVMVNDPALLLIGSPLWIVWVILTTALGIYVLSGAVIGWYVTEASKLERLAGVIGSIFLVTPTMVTDYAGLAICIIVLFNSYRKAKKLKEVSA